MLENMVGGGFEATVVESYRTDTQSVEGYMRSEGDEDEPLQ